MEMVFVKCGRMKIGCTSEQVNNCEINERYEHDVELSGYYIGKYPVTQRQWAALMGVNPSNFKGDDDRPVEMVSWDDAQAFIDKLNESSSRKKYRLPTEAEWEYAARGGVNSKGYVYSGGNNADGVAWYSDNSGGSVSGFPRPVGAKAPNELGLHDMSGNVREWVSDWWADRYERTPPNTLVGTPFVNPQGPETGVNRVTRGGSYAQDAVSCRVSARSYLSPELKRNFVGFRVALSAE
jgi:formylglycine-generating enzyme required for sulfatase activity